MKIPHTFIALPLLVFSLPLQAQHQHPTSPPLGSKSIVKLIADGSKEPQMIPDEAALRVLFLSIAIPTDPTQRQLANYDNKIRRMSLNSADRNVFISAMKSFHAQKQVHQASLALSSQQMKFAVPATTGPILNKIVATNGLIDKLAVDTYNSLSLTLSPEGWDKLKAHLAYAKTKMKLIPPPPM